MNKPSTITITIADTYAVNLSKESINHIKGDSLVSASKAIVIGTQHVAAIETLIEFALKSIVAQLVKGEKPIDSQDFQSMLNKLTNESILSSVTEEKKRGAKANEYPAPTRIADFKLIAALCMVAKAPLTIGVEIATLSKAQFLSITQLTALSLKLITIAEKAGESKHASMYSDAIDACIRFSGYINEVVEIKQAMEKSLRSVEVMPTELAFE